MSLVNNVKLIGHLGKTPELKRTKGGVALLGLALAITERVKTENGWENKTTWTYPAVFGKRAEGLSEILSKGMKVVVSAKLANREFKDDQGKTTKTELSLLLDDIEILSYPKDFDIEKRRNQGGNTENFEDDINFNDEEFNF